MNGCTELFQVRNSVRVNCSETLYRVITGALGPANFSLILLLHRGCSLKEVKLYCHGPVVTTELERLNVLRGTFETFDVTCTPPTLI